MWGNEGGGCGGSEGWRMWVCGEMRVEGVGEVRVEGVGEVRVEGVGEVEGVGRRGKRGWRV